MDDLKNPISSISFKGYMRATVIKRDDDKLEGRIGVNIHKLMPDEDHTNTKEKESIETPKQQTKFFSSESEVKPIENEQITSKNYYWARPCFRFANSKGKTSGNYLVPQIGELVVVYFEDNDPQKCRYLPFDIVKDGEKLLELEKTFKKENLEDPIKKPNIEILTKTPNNNIIGFDYNEDTNQYIVKFNNGNYYLMESNEGVNKIELNTTTGRTKITMDDKIPKITIKSDKDIEINGSKSTIINTTNTTINSSAKTTVNSETDIVGNTKIDGITSTTSNLFSGGSLVSNGLFVTGPAVLNGLAIATIANSGGSVPPTPTGGDTSGGNSGGAVSSVIDLSQYILKNTNIVGNTFTKITYDSKGLVTSGSNATTEDIVETNNKKFISSSQLTSLEALINSNNISNFFLYTQTTLSNTWTIVHNLNGVVSVDVYNELGIKTITSFTVMDNNSLTVDLSVPMLGYAYVYKKTTGFYKFIKLTPSDTWEVPHNLDGIITVEVFNSLGNKIMASYRPIDNNNVRINLLTPISGYSYISKIN